MKTRGFTRSFDNKEDIRKQYYVKINMGLSSPYYYRHEIVLSALQLLDVGQKCRFY